MFRSSSPYLLVTRPHPEGRSTCQRLRSMGYNVQWRPLLHCVHFEESTILNQLETLPSLELLVITSSRAISALSETIMARISYCTVVTVGKKTENIAKQKGFHHVLFGGEHMGQLATYIRSHFYNKTLTHFTRPFVYEGAQDLLACSLSEYSIANLLTYQMLPCALHSLRTLTHQGRPSGVLIFSQQMSHLLASYICEEENLWRNIPFFCLSKRVSFPLLPFMLKHLFHAKTPTMQALTQMIYKHLPPHHCIS